MRSPFGAIEDWNTAGCGNLPKEPVAVALRGDRGLEHFGALRGHTPTLQVAVALRGDRGLEPIPPSLPRESSGRCGRPSGRSRIGTPARTPPASPRCVAVALRGDRGLEHQAEGALDIAVRLRSPFGAIEDWNQLTPGLTANSIRVAVALRGDRGLERPTTWKLHLRVWLRSPFGAIEDWNMMGFNFLGQAVGVAVALRGDRGLERQVCRLYSDCYRCGRPSGRSRIGTTLKCPASLLFTVAVALRGDRGLEPVSPHLPLLCRLCRCGRPSGRSRIGTSSCFLLARSARLRSPFGAIEDWNRRLIESRYATLRVAVALRGDRGLEPRPSQGGLPAPIVAVALRGDRGLEPIRNHTECANALVVVALRGDRGLEP